MATISSCNASPDSVTECAGDTFVQFEVVISNPSFDFVTVEWAGMINGQELDRSQITVGPDTEDSDVLTVTLPNSGDNCLSPGQHGYTAEITNETIEQFAPQEEEEEEMWASPSGCGVCGSGRTDEGVLSSAIGRSW